MFARKRRKRLLAKLAPYTMRTKRGTFIAYSKVWIDSLGGNVAAKLKLNEYNTSLKRHGAPRGFGA